MAGALNPKNGHTNGAAPAAGVHSFTMAELIGKAPKQMDYLPLLGHDGVFIKGATHLLASWWRVGKSETLAQACVEWLEAGHKIVWLSEEPEDPVWRDRCLELVDRAGLEVPWGNLRMVDVFAAGTPKDHLKSVTDGPEDIVILDTVYTVIGCADEDKASIVRPAMMPWISAVRAGGKTLIGLVHHRKADGKQGERVSGSHALPALFDVVIEMATVDEAHPNLRKISGRARRVRVPDLTLEMDEEGKIAVVGTGSQIDGKELYRMLVELLGKRGTMPTKDIAAALSHVSSPRTVERGLVTLARANHILRTPGILEPAKGRRITWALADQTRFAS
jgi:hypothetical protein